MKVDTDDFDPDDLRRRKLRAAFTALADLDQALNPNSDMPISIAVENAVEGLKSAATNDFISTCEGCSGILLEGDHGQRCTEGELLCAECAASWGEIKDQWDKDEIEEEEPGQKARFMAKYDAHIAGGGSPDDLLTYPL